MAKKKVFLEQISNTPEGNPIISKVGKYCFTYGLPLEIILQHFKIHNYVVNWVGYLQDSFNDGHNKQTTLSRISSAVGDIYGPDYRDNVDKRAKEWADAIWNSSVINKDI